MIPKYMYHYTSIDKLKKILESNKIRFTRLDSLNDPYEGVFIFDNCAETNNEYRKYKYCSCWSSEEHENLALWYMYTQMVGCRIKIKSAMFSNSFVLQEYKSAYFPVSSIERISINTYIDDNKTILKSAVNKVTGPIKITYVQSLNQTYNSAIGKSLANKGKDNEFVMCDIDLDELGIRKVDAWSIENEWRYTASPYVGFHFSESLMNRPISFITPDYIDIPLSSKIEEVLLAPRVTDDEFDSLNLFLKAQHYDFKIKRSSIKVR